MNDSSIDAQTQLNNAVDLFKQMAQALSKFESQGEFFTDMKNKNWLIKNNGGKQELAIADTKSFLQIESDGTVTPGVGLNNSDSWSPSTQYASHFAATKTINFTTISKKNKYFS